LAFYMVFIRISSGNSFFKQMLFHKNEVSLFVMLEISMFRHLKKCLT